MAQRFGPKKGEIFNWRPAVQQFTSTELRALTRIGYDKGPIGELDWFIRLANTNLESASDGEVLLLQEEFNAFDKAHLNSPYRYQLADEKYARITEVPFLPSHEDILKVQTMIRSSLSELADKSWTRLPEMPTQISICFPRRLEKTVSAHTFDAYDIPHCAVSHHVISPSFTKFVYFMGHLIEKVGKVILRCPHCRNIFLQSRLNQEHCSRSCQSVSAVQRRRAEIKAQRGRTIGKRKRPAKNGGVSHGKKRR